MKKRVVLMRSNPVRPYPRLEKMANCLLKQGYGVQILAWDRDDNYEPRVEKLNLPNGTVDITRIGIKGQFSGGIKKNLKGLLSFQIFIRQWLINNQNSYDVIHAYDFDTGFTARLCATKLKKKFVYDIPDYYVDSHGISNKLVKTIVKNCEDKVITKSDATIICTEERKEQIKDASPQKLVVIHNTPAETISPVQKKMNHRLKLVYVGIFGGTRFIDKIAETVSMRSDCEFHIGGFGGDMEHYFHDMADKYENIFYYGRIPYDRTLELENECDVMCAMYDPLVRNHYYAAPNKFYEALMLGKPLLMAQRTGMASIVEENGFGEVIEYNEEALNGALDKLVASRDSFDAIGIAEKEYYSKHYSWEMMENRIINLYENL